MSYKSNQKKFTTNYPLKHKVVRDLRIVTEHVGDLQIDGTLYQDPNESSFFDRYSVDIDFVRWNGVDIKPVLEATGGLDDIIDNVLRSAASFFEAKEELAA